MSIPDEVIVRFFDYGTNIWPMTRSTKSRPNSSPARSSPWMPSAASLAPSSPNGTATTQRRSAEEQWTRTFSQRNVPDDIPDAPIEFAVR